MRWHYSELIYGLWLLLAVFYWISLMAGLKPAKWRESIVSRVRHLGLLYLGFLFLLAQGLGVGVLGWRWLPASAAVEALGAVLVAAGVVFAIWARHELGTNWSGIVTIKEGHRLVRSGPYALSRNPIYTGFVVAALGTAVAVGELRGLVGLACIVAAVTIKADGTFPVGGVRR